MAETNPAINFDEDEGIVYDLWENLDEKTLEWEISFTNTHISDFANHLARMVADNDYENTLQMCKNLWLQDLYHDSWIYKFHQTNREYFSKYMTNHTKPTWYADLPVDKKKAYDTVMTYYTDTFYLLQIMDVMFDMVTALDPMLNYGFRLQRIKMNFDEANLNETLYEKIGLDMADVSRHLNQSWDSMERDAHRAEIYYRDNAGRSSSKDSLNRGYRQERIKDYQDSIKRCHIYDSIVDNGNGTFSVKPGVMATMKAIYKYTGKVAQLDDFEDRMKKVNEKCKNLLTVELPKGLKDCKTFACRGVIAACMSLCEKAQEFCEVSLEMYDKFKEGDDDAPYCFMKTPDTFSSLKSNYSFGLYNWYDPWGTGANYVIMYENAVKSLNDHCRDFVYNHGHQELK